MNRAEAISEYGEPDEQGHVTRFTDSSFRDFVCVLCGADDGYIIGGNGGLNKPCSKLEKTMKTHEVKSWNFLYEPIVDGRKTHDLRKNDRDYKVGDRLLLREYNPSVGTYTGREALTEITFITSSMTPCALSSNALASDHAILSIKLLAQTANAGSGGWPMDDIRIVEEVK